MFYALYLVGIVIYLVRGTGGNFSDFADQITGMYILTPCILMLFCTKSFRAFGRGVLFAFGRKEVSLVQCRESLQSVWMMILTAVVSGMLCFFIGMINSCRSLAVGWSSADSVWLLLDTAVAMLSLFYPMVVCLIFLPVFFLLKRQLIVLQKSIPEQDISD